MSTGTDRMLVEHVPQGLAHLLQADAQVTAGVGGIVVTEGLQADHGATEQTFGQVGINGGEPRLRVALRS